jgi:hypothetical protein
MVGFVLVILFYHSYDLHFVNSYSIIGTWSYFVVNIINTPVIAISSLIFYIGEKDTLAKAKAFITRVEIILLLVDL